MPITQILLTSTEAAPPPPPPETPQGTYLFQGSTANWAAVGTSPTSPDYTSSYAFPDGSTGQAWTFNGTGDWMTTQQSGQLTAMSMNIWFYPEVLGTQFMTIQDSYTENSGYTHTAVDINSDSTISAGLWNGGGVASVTTSNKVVMNEWNHLYIAHTGSQLRVRLNGGTQITSNFAWSYPGNFVAGIGTYSITNISQTARFCGKIAEVSLRSSVVASNYESTKSKYQLAPRIFLDANNPFSYGPPDATAGPPSLGLGGSGEIAVFQQSDFTSGLLAGVAVGWWVKGANGATTVITSVDAGASGELVVSDSWLGLTAPFKFRDPGIFSVTTWYNLASEIRNATLYNAPTFNTGATKSYEFLPSALQWGKIDPIGNLPRWTVETWIDLTASLGTTEATAVVTTVYNDEDFGGQGAINRINYCIGNNFVSPGYTAIKPGFWDGAWRETSGVVPVVGGWVHLVGTYDGHTLRYYLNGDNAGTYQYSGTPSANGGAIRIARRWDGPQNSAHFFPGKIGLIRVYEQARNDAEIKAAYTATRATYGV